MPTTPTACSRWCAPATAERQQDGISFILIDMKTPGITTRPILTIGGDHEVNQVFFDDVRVPVANRVGEEGKGWTYGKYLLEFERGSGIASAKLREGLKAIAELAESDLTGRAIDEPDIAAAHLRGRNRHRRAGDDRAARALRTSDRAKSRRGVVDPEAAQQRDPAGRDAARRRRDRPRRPRGRADAPALQAQPRAGDA